MPLTINDEVKKLAQSLQEPPDEEQAPKGLTISDSAKAFAERLITAPAVGTSVAQPVMEEPEYTPVNPTPKGQGGWDALVPKTFPEMFQNARNNFGLPLNLDINRISDNASGSLAFAGKQAINPLNGLPDMAMAAAGMPTEIIRRFVIPALEGLPSAISDLTLMQMGIPLEVGQMIVDPFKTKPMQSMKKEWDEKPLWIGEKYAKSMIDGFKYMVENPKEMIENDPTGALLFALGSKMGGKRALSGGRNPNVLFNSVVPDILKDARKNMAISAHPSHRSMYAVSGYPEPTATQKFIGRSSDIGDLNAQTIDLITQNRIPFVEEVFRTGGNIRDALRLKSIDQKEYIAARRKLIASRKLSEDVTRIIQGMKTSSTDNLLGNYKKFDAAPNKEAVSIALANAIDDLKLSIPEELKKFRVPESENKYDIPGEIEKYGVAIGTPEPIETLPGLKGLVEESRKLKQQRTAYRDPITKELFSEEKVRQKANAILDGEIEKLKKIIFSEPLDLNIQSSFRESPAYKDAYNRLSDLSFPLNREKAIDAIVAKYVPETLEPKALSLRMDQIVNTNPLGKTHVGNITQGDMGNLVESIKMILEHEESVDWTKIDALKQALDSNIDRYRLADPSSRSSAFTEIMRKKVYKILDENVEGYAEAMKGYETARNIEKEMVDIWGLNSGNIDAKTQKIMDSFVSGPENEAAVKYIQALELADDGTEEWQKKSKLREKIAGLKTQELFGHGLYGTSKGVGAALAAPGIAAGTFGSIAFGAGFSNPASALAAALGGAAGFAVTSPKIASKYLETLGVVKREIRGITNILNKIHEAAEKKGLTGINISKSGLEYMNYGDLIERLYMSDAERQVAEAKDREQEAIEIDMNKNGIPYVAPTNEKQTEKGQ